MQPYFVFLFVTLIIAFFSLNKSGDKAGLFLLFLVMTLFAGLRSSIVGTDANSYANSFEEAYQTQQWDNVISFLGSEPGFVYLTKALSLFSREYISLFLGVSAVFSFFVIKSIKQRSERPLLSLFVFITLGYYTFSFNTMRQALALAIYMQAIPYLLNRKVKEYIGIVLIAALFHKTIAVAIPLYYIFTMKYSFKSIALMLIGGITIGSLLPSLLAYTSTIEDRYQLYETRDASGGLLLTVFYVILALFFIWQRRYIQTEKLKEYDVFLHMLLVGSSIYVFVTFLGAYVELTRFAAYFQVSSIFLWSLIAKHGKPQLYKTILIPALIGHLGFFAMFLSKMANLVPYVLNEGIFK